jgi:hypothetical protein
MRSEAAALPAVFVGATREDAALAIAARAAGYYWLLSSRFSGSRA